MPTVTIKQHDTKVIFRDTPTVNGVALTSGDLAGATLKFILKDRSGIITRTATINGDATFSYQVTAPDVANITEFKQEWEVTFADGKILTFPNNAYNVVKVIADLGP